jgi:hypothetical protein
VRISTSKNYVNRYIFFAVRMQMISHSGNDLTHFVRKDLRHILAAFTKGLASGENRSSLLKFPSCQEPLMPVTGELIRLQNYIDDIATTLRKISATLPFMTEEERKALAEYMKKSDPNFSKVLERLESGK